MSLWRQRAADSAIQSAYAAIRTEVEQQIRTARPVCLASGKCCHFERYGHRLMVSGLEVALVEQSLPPDQRPDAATVARSIKDGTCPFLAGGLCGIHAARPIPCRTFFCDTTVERATQGILEQAHTAIRALHDETGVPYAYGEWRQHLLRFASAPSGATMEL